MTDEKILRFSADFGPTDFCAGPLGNPSVASARDIAIVHGPEAGEDPSQLDLIALPRFDRTRPREAGTAPDPIDLGRGVRIVRLDRDEAERILTACAPRGHYFVPVRQFGQAYSFEWKVPDESWRGEPYNWDPQHELQAALAMSRFVLDNGYSTQYAARVMDYDDGQQQVIPVMAQQKVWRIQSGRDWMTYSEAQALRDLLGAYWNVRDDLPGRVARALWLADFAVEVGSLEVRLPLMVVALEAFTNTTDTKVTKQFCKRIPRMAGEAGVDGVDYELCDWAYDMRSRWAHGQQLGLVPAQSRAVQDGQGEANQPVTAEEQTNAENADLLQRALRAIVRKALEDPEFCSHFAEDDLLRTRWPVSGRVERSDGSVEEIQL